MTARFRARLKLVGGRLLLAAGVPLLLLAAAEGLLRATGRGLPADFLRPGRSRAEPAWTGNPFYGYRFFPPAMARNPPPLSCPRPKPPGTVRLVILGESAAMGDPLIEFGAPRLLEKMLNYSGAGPRFEVINAAMTAINSPVIADIASELPRLQPDVVIVYMGNNEVVGPFGPGPRARGRLATRLIPLRVALTRSRAVLALKLALETVAAARHPPQDFHMDALGRLELRADDPRLESVYALFENRLGRILDHARRAGAETLLCTMAVNRTGCPPFGSRNRGDWSEDERARWQEAYARGVQAQAAGRRPAARAAFETAAQLDAGHAELAYRLAQTLAASGPAAEAGAWYARARDADTRRFRTDSRLNQILRDTARRRAVELVDAEADFREAAQDDTLFLDHVHFTLEGTGRLAGLWFDAIARRHPGLVKPDLATCRDRLLFNAWGELRQAQSMAARYARPPFTGQLDNAARQAALAATLQRCHQAIAVTNLFWLRSQYPEHVARDPGDAFYPLQWSSILLASGQLAEALPLLLDYLERLPHHFEARILPAFVLAKSGRPADAAGLLVDAGPPYGLYLATHATGVIEGLLADGFRREARLFGQAVLDRRGAFSGRPALAALVARL
jgi:tetratricopeptide (TPR) repeat protein